MQSDDPRQHAAAYLEGERRRVTADIQAMRERIGTRIPDAGKAAETAGFGGRITSLAELRRQARQEGWREGYLEGLEDGRREAEEDES